MKSLNQSEIGSSNFILQKMRGRQGAASLFLPLANVHLSAILSKLFKENKNGKAAHFTGR